MVAFRSAKGAFRLRPFAGAKGDYQGASSRARTSQRSRRQGSAAIVALRPEKEHVDDIISYVLSPLSAAKKMALSGTFWHFLAGSAAPISFVKIDLGQIAPEFSAIFWHSPQF
jgi:hypothetical protein